MRHTTPSTVRRARGGSHRWIDLSQPSRSGKSVVRNATPKCCALKPVSILQKAISSVHRIPERSILSLIRFLHAPSTELPAMDEPLEDIRHSARGRDYGRCSSLHL